MADPAVASGGSLNAGGVREAYFTDRKERDVAGFTALS